MQQAAALSPDQAAAVGVEAQAALVAATCPVDATEAKQLQLQVAVKRLGQLHLINDGQQSVCASLREGAYVLVGKDPLVKLRLTGQLVSRQHFFLTDDGRGGVLLTDSSLHGTYLIRKAVPSEGPSWQWVTACFVKGLFKQVKGTTVRLPDAPCCIVAGLSEDCLPKVTTDKMPPAASILLWQPDMQDNNLATATGCVNPFVANKVLPIAAHQTKSAHAARESASLLPTTACEELLHARPKQRKQQLSKHNTTVPSLSQPSHLPITQHAPSQATLSTIDKLLQQLPIAPHPNSLRTHTNPQLVRKPRAQPRPVSQPTRQRKSMPLVQAFALFHLPPPGPKRKSLKLQPSKAKAVAESKKRRKGKLVMLPTALVGVQEGKQQGRKRKLCVHGPLTAAGAAADADALAHAVRDAKVKACKTARSMAGKGPRQKRQRETDAFPETSTVAISNTGQDVHEQDPVRFDCTIPMDKQQGEDNDGQSPTKAAPKKCRRKQVLMPSSAIVEPAVGVTEQRIRRAAAAITSDCNKTYESLTEEGAGKTARKTRLLTSANPATMHKQAAVVAAATGTEMDPADASAVHVTGKGTGKGMSTVKVKPTAKLRTRAVVMAAAAANAADNLQQAKVPMAKRRKLINPDTVNQYDDDPSRKCADMRQATVEVAEVPVAISNTLVTETAAADLLQHHDHCDEAATALPATTHNLDQDEDAAQAAANPAGASPTALKAAHKRSRKTPATADVNNPPPPTKQTEPDAQPKGVAMQSAPPVPIPAITLHNVGEAIVHHMAHTTAQPLLEKPCSGAKAEQDQIGAKRHDQLPHLQGQGTNHNSCRRQGKRRAGHSETAAQPLSGATKEPQTAAVSTQEPHSSILHKQHNTHPEPPAGLLSKKGQAGGLKLQEGAHEPGRHQPASRPQRTCKVKALQKLCRAEANDWLQDLQMICIPQVSDEKQHADQLANEQSFKPVADQPVIAQASNLAAQNSEDQKGQQLDVACPQPAMDVDGSYLQVQHAHAQATTASKRRVKTSVTFAPQETHMPSGKDNDKDTHPKKVPVENSIATGMTDITKVNKAVLTDGRAAKRTCKAVAAHADDSMTEAIVTAVHVLTDGIIAQASIAIAATTAATPVPTACHTGVAASMYPTDALQPRKQLDKAAKAAKSRSAKMSVARMPSRATATDAPVHDTIKDAHGHNPGTAVASTGDPTATAVAATAAAKAATAEADAATAGPLADSATAISKPQADMSVLDVAHTRAAGDIQVEVGQGPQPTSKANGNSVPGDAGLPVSKPTKNVKAAPKQQLQRKRQRGLKTDAVQLPPAPVGQAPSAVLRNQADAADASAVPNPAFAACAAHGIPLLEDALQHHQGCLPNNDSIGLSDSDCDLPKSACIPRNKCKRTKAATKRRAMLLTSDSEDASPVKQPRKAAAKKAKGKRPGHQGEMDASVPNQPCQAVDITGDVANIIKAPKMRSQNRHAEQQEQETADENAGKKVTKPVSKRPTMQLWDDQPDAAPWDVSPIVSSTPPVPGNCSNNPDVNHCLQTAAAAPPASAAAAAVADRQAVADAFQPTVKLVALADKNAGILTATAGSKHPQGQSIKPSLDVRGLLQKLHAAPKPADTTTLLPIVAAIAGPLAVAESGTIGAGSNLPESINGATAAKTISAGCADATVGIATAQKRVRFAGSTIGTAAVGSLPHKHKLSVAANHAIKPTAVQHLHSNFALSAIQKTDIATANKRPDDAPLIKTVTQVLVDGPLAPSSGTADGSATAMAAATAANLATASDKLPDLQPAPVQTSRPTGVQGPSHKHMLQQLFGSKKAVQLINNDVAAAANRSVAVAAKAQVGCVKPADNAASATTGPHTRTDNAAAASTHAAIAQKHGVGFTAEAVPHQLYAILQTGEEVEGDVNSRAAANEQHCTSAGAVAADTDTVAPNPASDRLNAKADNAGTTTDNMYGASKEPTSAAAYAGADRPVAARETLNTATDSLALASDTRKQHAVTDKRPTTTGAQDRRPNCVSADKHLELAEPLGDTDATLESAAAAAMAAIAVAISQTDNATANKGRRLSVASMPQRTSKRAVTKDVDLDIWPEAPAAASYPSKPSIAQAGAETAHGPKVLASHRVTIQAAKALTAAEFQPLVSSHTRGQAAKAPLAVDCRPQVSKRTRAEATLNDAQGAYELKTLVSNHNSVMAAPIDTDIRVEAAPKNQSSADKSGRARVNERPTAGPAEEDHIATDDFPHTSTCHHAAATDPGQDLISAHVTCKPPDTLGHRNEDEVVDGPLPAIAAAPVLLSTKASCPTIQSVKADSSMLPADVPQKEAAKKPHGGVFAARHAEVLRAEQQLATHKKTAASAKGKRVRARN